jgi:hypothetical protein
MRHFIAFFKNILRSTEQKPLGRWAIDYSYTTINKKVDQSNEDHCGSCSKETVKPTREIDEYYFL